MHRKKRKNFAFKPTLEYIKETMDMPARSKLEWLEEVNNFVYKALPRKKLKIWEKFKKGEI
jgi:hypothetical protein